MYMAGKGGALARSVASCCRRRHFTPLTAGGPGRRSPGTRCQACPRPGTGCWSTRANDGADINPHTHVRHRRPRPSRRRSGPARPRHVPLHAVAAAAEEAGHFGRALAELARLLAAALARAARDELGPSLLGGRLPALAGARVGAKALGKRKDRHGRRHDHSPRPSAGREGQRAARHRTARASAARAPRPAPDARPAREISRGKTPRLPAGSIPMLPFAQTPPDSAAAARVHERRQRPHRDEFRGIIAHTRLPPQPDALPVRDQPLPTACKQAAASRSRRGRESAREPRRRGDGVAHQGRRPAATESRHALRLPGATQGRPAV
jgi:hypothetical protein